VWLRICDLLHGRRYLFSHQLSFLQLISGIVATRGIFLLTWCVLTKTWKNQHQDDDMQSNVFGGIQFRIQSNSYKIIFLFSHTTNEFLWFWIFKLVKYDRRGEFSPVLRRTVCDDIDWRFHNLSGSHHQGHWSLSWLVDELTMLLVVRQLSRDEYSTRVKFWKARRGHFTKKKLYAGNSSPKWFVGCPYL